MQVPTQPLTSLASRLLLALALLTALLLALAIAGWLASRTPVAGLATLHLAIMGLGGLGVLAGAAGLVVSAALVRALSASSRASILLALDGVSASVSDTSLMPADAIRDPAGSTNPRLTAPATTASPASNSTGAEVGDAEMARLQQAVAAMQASLREVMRGVREKAEVQRQALGGLDAAARPELRPGTPAHPARTHQLSTPAGRLTLVSGAPSLRVDHAVDAAQRSAEVVAQVVGNLEEMSAASRRILDTVSVIDSIAFQTNLLALNAAVEVARAGDQGRAARVVAADVRMLAQRAATAAREIKGLMGETLHKLEAGGRGLRDNSQTMDAIVSSVQCVTDIVGHIQQTPGAAPQSAEISIEQLDQMTQQNTMLVQQSAGAAESLRVQAERLHKVVAAFRLLQHTQEAAWTAHSAISGARRSARFDGGAGISGSKPGSPHSGAAPVPDKPDDQAG
jgi:methyl-accepting chemotaxis protein